MEGASSASAETSRSAYFAARSSQLGTIEAESGMDGTLRVRLIQSVHNYIYGHLKYM